MGKLLLVFSFLCCCVVSGVGSSFLPSSGESLEEEKMMDVQLNENKGNDNNADKGRTNQFVAKDYSYTGPKSPRKSTGWKGSNENDQQIDNNSQKMGVKCHDQWKAQGIPESLQRIEKPRQLQMGTTVAPTMGSPTMAPSKLPTMAPLLIMNPTKAPTKIPTKAPLKTTGDPTKVPTMAPTKAPTMAPTKAPTMAPTMAPSPTIAPTDRPLRVRTYEGGKKEFTEKAVKAPKAPKNVFTSKKKF